MNDAPNIDHSSAETLAAVVDRVAFICLLCFFSVLLLYGCCIGGLVYKEPDICFLLAGGRWIVEHGHLPQSDPFSYTTHYHWAKYVIEKWLTEVIFYKVWSVAGGLGLLIFDSCLLALAFVVMPFRILYLGGWRGLALMLVVVIAIWTSCSHLAVRPEIFSFLLTAIFIEVLLRVSTSTAGNTRIDWKSILFLAVLSCLWSNLHTLFLVGIFLPLLYSICMFAEKLIPELRGKPVNWTVPLAFIACLLASLVNPYGIGLWQYMPNVFGPFNDTNNEMQSIKLSTASSFAFWPFYLMIICGFVALLKRGGQRPLKQNDLFFRLLIPIGTACGIKTIRSIPLADLLILAGLARTALISR